MTLKSSFPSESRSSFALPIPVSAFYLSIFPAAYRTAVESLASGEKVTKRNRAGGMMLTMMLRRSAMHICD